MVDGPIFRAVVEGSGLENSEFMAFFRRSLATPSCNPRRLGEWSYVSAPRFCRIVLW